MFLVNQFNYILALYRFSKACDVLTGLVMLVSCRQSLRTVMKFATL